MKFILAKKEYMTQVFDESGKVSVVTVLSLAPSVITQVKTKEVDGYNSVQIGFEKTVAKRINKPQLGHAKDSGPWKTFREFRMNDVSGFNKGDDITADIFVPGDKIEISSQSKGKGFQGVVKLSLIHI